MPALNYDYDYLANYEIEEESESIFQRKHNNYKRTSAKTKEQVIKFMRESSEESEARKGAKKGETINSSFVRRVYDFDDAERSNRLFNFDVASRSDVTIKEEAKPEAIELEDDEEEERKGSKEGSTFSSVKKMGFFLIAACVALFICYRYSMINEKFNSVEKAKKVWLNAQTVNEQLQAEIDSETDISYVENYARYQLGMQKPQDSQIVYINVTKQDKVFTPIKLVEEKQSTWVDSVIEKLANTF